MLITINYLLLISYDYEIRILQLQKYTLRNILSTKSLRVTSDAFPRKDGPIL